MSRNDIPHVEQLERKRAEMEEELERREKSKYDPVHLWWELRRPELDKTIARWTVRDTEPNQDRQVEVF